MSTTIDTTVQAVRRISSELRPKLLDDLGLSAAIEWQAREFEERSGIQCDIQSEPEDIVLDGALDHGAVSDFPGNVHQRRKARGRHQGGRAASERAPARWR